VNRRLSRIALLPVALLVILPAIALGSSHPVFVTSTCTKEQYKPKSVVLTCGDGLTSLTKMTWSAWSRTSAHGAGTFQTNTCTPNCAAGKPVYVPVTVVLSKPKACKNQAHDTFTAVKLTFTATPPANTPRSYTITCPI
jgi:hypothetical protein